VEQGGYTPTVKRVDRRQAFSIWASGIASAASACTGTGTTVLQTAEGPVLRLEKDDFLVLVSGFQSTYRPGERVTVKVLVNNQSTRFAAARIRTKLLGRGQQAVVETEVASITVKPFDATETERTMLLPGNLPAGDYTLMVELPPWSFEGRQAGGGSLSTSVSVVLA
jgi:hypothetical protein